MNARLVTSAEIKAALPAKERMIATLRDLLRETCRLRNEGAAYAKLSHSQGYADGYMKVLVDAGYVTSHDLLEIIRDVRRGVDGPATKTVTVETSALSA